MDCYSLHCRIGGTLSKLTTFRVLHHLCATADGLLPLFPLSGVNVRCASVLTYFIVFEAPVFYGLVLYRLYPKSKWTPIVIRWGMWIFGLTRPAHLVWIMGIIITTRGDDHVDAWHSVTQAFFWCVLYRVAARHTHDPPITL